MSPRHPSVLTPNPGPNLGPNPGPSSSPGLSRSVMVALLGVLLAFVAPLISQQASAAEPGHGVTGTLNQLAVLSHLDGLRASAQRGDGDRNDEASGENPDGWLSRWADSATSPHIRAVYLPRAAYSARPTRFFTPLLRAPPVMSSSAFC